jgi:predicted nucleic acid-binding protein
MIVADTNLISYLFLSSPHSAQAEQIFLKDPEWAVPILWRSELRNVLATYLHNKILTLDEACQIMDEAAHMMRGREYEVGSLPVLYLTSSSPCSAYDCEFVALAKDLDIPLVTIDRQILQYFPDTAVGFNGFLSDEQSTQP